MKWTALLLFVVGCLPPDAQAPPASTLTVTSGTPVVEVADGDSFRTDTDEVRLLGINAPERDECYGDEARAWLAELIEGEVIELESGAFDQFGRVLAVARLNGLNLNHEAVASGHALALSSGLAVIDGLGEAEENARTNGLGMWGEDICGGQGHVGELSITELDYNPPGNDEIELAVVTNTGSVTVDLGGFRLRDESSVNRFDFPAYSLAPGESVTISTGCAAGVGLLAWCTSDPVWNNDGDTALLLDSFGRVVAVERY